MPPCSGFSDTATYRISLSSRAVTFVRLQGRHPLKDETPSSCFNSEVLVTPVHRDTTRAFTAHSVRDLLNLSGRVDCTNMLIHVVGECYRHIRMDDTSWVASRATQHVSSAEETRPKCYQSKNSGCSDHLIWRQLHTYFGHEAPNFVAGKAWNDIVRR